MRVFIDGDSAPIIDIAIDVSRKYDIEVIIVKDVNHDLKNFNYDKLNIITIDQGRDNADLYIINNIKKGDIVVTSDLGLASLVLGKTDKCINFNGLIINNNNLDGLMMNRYINANLRRQNIYSKGPSKRKKEDDKNFKVNLERIIKD
ncbi:MAG: YaiI/YqxD family protein [Tissierellia bacterium]|nr:YaiI/YqxD family protein [Tissierellia bacterium]